MQRYFYQPLAWMHFAHCRSTSRALLAGMLFGMSQALSPTPPWNVRLNVGGTNTEFEYQNPRVPQHCSFRNWQVSHMSAQLLSNSKNKHALGCWGRRGRWGGFCFGLVFAYPL